MCLDAGWPSARTRWMRCGRMLPLLFVHLALHTRKNIRRSAAWRSRLSCGGAATWRVDHDRFTHDPSREIPPLGGFQRLFPVRRFPVCRVGGNGYCSRHQSVGWRPLRRGCRIGSTSVSEPPIVESKNG
jgi:hypothetical protein